MLPDFRLETFFSRWEFTAKYNICGSDMETLSMSEVLAMANDEDRARWDSLHLGYTETFGAPELREAIASTYDNANADNIIVFAGAEEGIFCAMQTLLQADDHAIVFTPNYQSAETLPNAICEVTGVPLNPEQNWDLDLQKVEDAIRPNTKLISFNFPHNPTGKVISRESLTGLIEIARRSGIYLFSDEVYRLLEWSDDLRLPQVADQYERGISLNVMSKAYGLPGLRIGWIATQDKELLGRLERTKHYLSICNSAPSEVLATMALYARDKILERNRNIIGDNLKVLNDFFIANADLFDWTVPDGGCIGYPRYLGSDGVEKFCSNLVERTGVLLLPSSVYRSALGPTPQNRFRIGFGRLHMPEGVDVLRSYLEKLAA